MAKQSFWDHPIEKLEEALQLKKQIHALQTKLSNMFGSDEEVPSAPVAAGKKRGGKRYFSEETKAKMAASQKARWLKKNGGDAEAASSSLIKAKGTRKKRKLSPEGRARIVAALKARHAAARGAK